MTARKIIISIFIFIVLSLFGLNVFAQTQDPVILTDDQDHYPLGLHLEILEDENGEWTIEDVTSPALAAQFVPSQEESPSYGFSDSVYWVRFHVKNEADPASSWLFFMDTNFSYIEFYRPDANEQGYEVVKTGIALPFSTREVPSAHYAFHLPVPPMQTETYYVRLESEETIILNFSIWAADAFFQKGLATQTVNSFFYGILFILAIYNLVLFFYLNDNSYLYYVLFFGTVLLTMMSLDGFSNQYLWPNWPQFADGAARTFFVLTFTFALLFSTSFLRTKLYTPRLHKIMLGLAAAIIIVLGLQFIWYRETGLLHTLLVAMSGIIMIFAGILVWRKGYHPARYFLFGWLAFLVGIIIFVLTLAGFIPWTAGGLTMIRLGLVVLALVLSIGLADRVRVYRKDKDTAQQDLLQNQKEYAESLKQANKELAEQFEESTHDLSFAHEQLESLFEYSPLAIGTAAMDGQVLTANEALKRILGYPGEEIFEASVLDFFADEQFRNELMADLIENKVARAPVVHLKRQDGTVFYANITESILTRKDESVFLGIVDDITDQVLAEQEQLKKAEETAVTEERERIARELHDSVTQTLYSASLIAEAVPKFWQQKPEEAAQDLDELRILTQGAQAEMRTLLLELRPNELVDRKLPELLRQLTDAMAARTELPISLTIAGECQVPPDVQIAYYRITQESLNNIHKHAKADRAWVVLKCEEDSLTLHVGDNGRGFDPDMHKINHMGLPIMRERAEAIHADLTINTQLDQGTEVIVIWQPAE